MKIRATITPLRRNSGRYGQPLRRHTPDGTRPPQHQRGQSQDRRRPVTSRALSDREELGCFCVVLPLSEHAPTRPNLPGVPREPAAGRRSAGIKCCPPTHCCRWCSHNRLSKASRSAVIAGSPATATTPAARTVSASIGRSTHSAGLTRRPHRWSPAGTWTHGPDGRRSRSSTRAGHSGKSGRRTPAWRWIYQRSPSGSATYRCAPYAARTLNSG